MDRFCRISFIDKTHGIISISLHTRNLYKKFIYLVKHIISTPTSQSLQQTSHRKYIECTHLQDDFEICLHRPFDDVYHNVCKEIIVITKDNRYHLFITHSDYELQIANGRCKITLKLETTLPPTIHLNGSEIHVTINCDLYELFFEKLSLPPPWNVSYTPSQDPIHISNQGLRLTHKTHQRGDLIIHTRIMYYMNMTLAHTHKTLLKKLLSI